MIIISKKRIILLTTILCVCFFICNIVVNSSNNNIDRLNKNTVETVALPITNKVIVIDAGHGVPDERSSK